MRLIDAEQLCKDLMKRWTTADKDKEKLISEVMAEVVTPIVIAQPTVNQWTPVSERLPEDEQNVLVTYKTTDKIHPCQYHDDGSRNPWYSYIDQCRAHMNVVLAWMPLPEPWGGDKE